MRILFLIPVLAGLALAGCVHTPPGTSVEIALAKKASLVRLPVPARTTVEPLRAASKAPAVESPLPEGGALVERVGEAYSRGIFCLQAGRDLEAIEAFQEVVKLNPGFTDAWQNLALLYEKTGEEKKAIEAFKRAKKIARQ
jgi:tetratricopeptide (TPR) repeat protein